MRACGVSFELSINLRISEALVRRLDLWRGQQPNPPTRPEAIRSILDQVCPPDTAVVTPLKRKAGRNA
jgi:hypothetical protein